MVCTNGITLKGNGGEWGTWSTVESCPVNTAICGIRTQIEPYQGSATTDDDTALNGVEFFCCKLQEYP